MKEGWTWFTSANSSLEIPTFAPSMKSTGLDNFQLKQFCFRLGLCSRGKTCLLVEICLVSLASL